MGLAKSLSDPRAIQVLEQLSKVPGNIELENSKSVGVFGLASAGFDPEISKGLGVLMELTKAMGKISIPGEAAK